MYDSHDDGRKKRVVKACDSCRMKKTKCDGRKPCSRCAQDDKLCTYSEKKKQQEKTYSSSYVELLETRIELLQDGLQKLVSKLANNEDISGYLPPDGDFSINKVIDLISQESGGTFHHHHNHSSSEDEGGSGASPTSSFGTPVKSTNILKPRRQIDEDDIEDEEDDEEEFYDEEHPEVNDTVREIKEERPVDQFSRQSTANSVISMESTYSSDFNQELISPATTFNADAISIASNDFDIENLSLGPYKSAMSMAAAVTGGFDGSLSPVASSPTTELLETSEILPWGTVSPALLIDTSAHPPAVSSSPTSSINVPYSFSNFMGAKSEQQNDGAAQRVGRLPTPVHHNTKVHKAGGGNGHQHHHGTNSPNPFYTKDSSSRRRERSRSKASSPRSSIDEKRNIANNLSSGRQLSHLHTATSFAADDDLNYVSFAQMDDLQTNLDEMAAGVTTSAPIVYMGNDESYIGGFTNDVRV